jgi:hypothetical protein
VNGDDGDDGDGKRRRFDDEVIWRSEEIESNLRKRTMQHNIRIS